MVASKQASKHKHTRVQCSPASVGLTQARPNYLLATCFLTGIQHYLLITCVLNRVHIGKKRLSEYHGIKSVQYT